MLMDFWLAGMFLVLVLEMWVDLLAIYTVLYLVCITLDVFFDGLELLNGLGFLSLN